MDPIAECTTVPDAASRRSANQGAVTRQLNSLTKLLSTPQLENLDECKSLVVKLVEAKGNFDRWNNRYVELLLMMEGNTHDAETGAHRLSQEVSRVHDAALKWIESVSCDGEQEPESAPQQVRADASGGVSVNSQGQDDRTTHDQSVRPKELSSTDVQGQLLRVLSALSDKIDNLTIKTGFERSFNEQRSVYEQTISSLQQELDYIRRDGRGMSTPVRPDGRRVTFDGDQSTVTHDSMKDDDQEARATRQLIRNVENCIQTKSNVASNANDHSSVSDVSVCDFLEQNVTVMKSIVSENRSYHQSFLASVRAPQPELVKYSGDPLEYTAFMSTFDDLVDDVYDNPRSKLTMLYSHCEGKAKKVISGCLHKSATEGYKLARELLKNKFGNPVLICETWLSKLMGYQQVKSADELESFAADLSSCRDSLSALNFLAELECTNSMRIVVSKLPNYLKDRWRKINRKMVSAGKLANVDQLITMVDDAAIELNDPVYSEASIARSRGLYDPTRAGRSGWSQARKGNVHVTESDAQDWEHETGADESYAMSSRMHCFQCGGQHFTSRCQLYRDLSPQDRLTLVRDKRLCVACLGDGHFRVDCPLRWRCQERGCSQRHHTSLHQAFAPVALEPVSQVTPASNMTTADENGVNTAEGYSVAAAIGGHRGSSKFSASLPLTPVVLSGLKGTIVTYALLDGASTMTLCTERLVSLLGLNKKGCVQTDLKTMTGKDSIEGNLVNLDIRGVGYDDILPVINAFTMKELPISGSHVIQASQLDKWPHLSSLGLPCAEFQAVDLLIGQSNAHLLEPLHKIKGNSLLDPYAVETPVGWTIYGFFHDCTPDSLYLIQNDSMVSVERMLEQFWRLDEVPYEREVLGDDAKVLKLWEDELYISQGHIHLPIPFRNDPPCLPDNYVVAKRRLELLGKRLLREPELLEKYREGMVKNVEQGFAELVDESQETISGSVWYIPHHAVTHARKPGKVRIVFDCSAEIRGVSLNRAVLQGPDLVSRLVDVLTKFRMFEITISGDIEGMYNQVKVPPRQRDVLRFLWWKNGDPLNEIVVHRMTTHLFGGIWSPSAAIFALQRCAGLFGGSYFEEARNAIVKHFYVDDWLHSVMSVQRGIALITDVRLLLMNGGFNITKFCSNDRSVIGSVDIDHRAKSVSQIDLNLDKLPVESALGVVYDLQKDEFRYAVNVARKPLTRRGMLSLMSSLYDPLGFISPFIMPAKRMIQELCKLGLGWDDCLPADVEAQWQRWVNDVTHISQFSIPRWLYLQRDTQLSLHCFSDASEVGYGAVLYGVAKADGQCQSNIVMSRSRLAPLKTQTIPRLELCAAVVASRLANAVCGYLHIDVKEVRFWTDSVLVLRYLKGEPSQFKTFVANRISEVLRTTNSCQWSFVPGELNVADMVSRGVTVHCLLKSVQWKIGPEFLRFDTDCWPKQPELSGLDADHVDRKRVKEIYVVKAEPKCEYVFEKLIANSSSWMRVVRTVCYVRRFIERCRGRTGVACPDLILATGEIQTSQQMVVRVTQRAFISQTQKVSRTFRKLFPCDQDGVLRVGGRLNYSDLPFNMRHPVVIPASAPIVRLIVEHFHKKVAHAGVDRTLHEIRSMFWVIHGKKLVAQILRNCVICKRLKGKAAEQLMAPLPEYRTRAGNPPFDVSGVDYFGPFQIKLGRARLKRYGCLFTCMSIRAIHLEVAADLTTSAFMNVFQRFSARRGSPSILISDNGTNFVGAAKELKGITEQFAEMRSCLGNKGVEWRFNVPAASHHGGVWERQIRTVRQLLMAIVSEQKLTDDGLATLFCTIEQIVNSRPITKLSSDPDSDVPLTPNHILVMRSCSEVPGSFVSADQFRAQWRQVQYLASLFWSRWTRQYLLGLQKRVKWDKVTENVKEGELVLVIKDNLPRNQWPLGLVRQVFPGPDGLVRSVKVKVSNAEFLRPITKLVRLEADIVVSE